MAAFHWILLIVDIKGRSIHLYDSLRQDVALSDSRIGLLRYYISTEAHNSTGTREDRDLSVTRVNDIDHWPVVVNEPYPKQLDGGSCGIFLLWVMEYLERSAVSRFQQKDILLLRARTITFLKGHDLHEVSHPKCSQS